MIKNYPNIYSLSTLGVIHHYKCDYLFHPLRTDFTGESGSGKSMIGDFLQLIFVGSEFTSSTIPLQGEKKREIKTMVLSKGNKTANAYIFLNIEVAPKQFLVIGVFIKSSINETKHFIIQKGFNKTNPDKYLDKPLLHYDLIFDDTIYELNELKDLLHGYQCFEYRIDLFTKTLKEIGILPYNLETEEQRKNFSIIIRAFAQGKGLKTENSDSLIKFLFDDNAEKEIISFWKSGSEKIEKEVRAYYKTNKDIAIIKEKANKVIRLVNNQDNYEKSELNYFNSLCFDYNDKIVHEKEELKIRKQVLTKYMIKKHLIEESIMGTEKLEKETVIKSISKNKKRIQEIDEEVEKLNKTDVKKKLELIEIELNKLTKPYSNILEVTEWLKRLEWSSLNEHYARQQEVERKQRILNDLLAYLQIKSAQTKYIKSLFAVDYGEAIEQYKLSIENLLKEISFLETIKKISDPGDKNSLAGWAIDRIKATGKPFTKQEESLLVYLQSLPREKAIKQEGISRYLNDPDILYSNIQISSLDNAGYWLDLKGINEFIPYYSDEQILNTINIADIKELFHKKYRTVDKLLKRSEQKLSKRIELLQLIQNYDNKEAFRIYPEKESLNSFQNIKGLTEDFETKISDYKKKDNILEQRSRLIKEKSSLDSIKTTIETLNKEKIELVDYVYGNPEDKLLESIKQINQVIEKVKRKLNIYDKRTELYFKTYSEFISESDKKSLDELKGENIKREDEQKKMLSIYRQIKQYQVEYDKAKNDFFHVTGMNFSPANVIKISEELITEIKSKYEAAKKVVEDYYSDEIIPMLPRTEEKQNEYSVVSIVNTVLPDIYKVKTKINLVEIITRINKYLEDIVRTNAEINTRHIHILYQAFNKHMISFPITMIVMEELKISFHNLKQIKLQAEIRLY
jgi:DNA repair protein SbcC/Rad50